MRTIYWLFTVFAVGVAMYKEGRGSVGDEYASVVASRQHVAIQQELLDSEFAQCVR